MKLNERMEQAYERLQESFSSLKKKSRSIVSLQYEFSPVAKELYHRARTEEEKVFARECEEKMLPYYQRALLQNYEAIKIQKEAGVPDYTKMEFWVLTVDQNQAPVRTTVVDVQGGLPVYADGCSAVAIDHVMRNVGYLRCDLEQWLEENENLYELRLAAEELKKKGPLGLGTAPEFNHDLSGLSGGQLDAAAWQNYAVANTMAPRTDYDKKLDYLLETIDQCIDFYEKAISIV